MIVQKDCNIFDGGAQGIIHQANCQNTMGSGIAKEIRANERTKDIPIIFLTAKGLDSDKDEADKLGAVGFVTKPFSPKSLLALVENILGNT